MSRLSGKLGTNIHFLKTYLSLFFFFCNVLPEGNSVGRYRGEVVEGRSAGGQCGGGER